MSLISHLAAVVRRIRNPEPVSSRDLMDLGLSRWEFDVLANSRSGMTGQIEAMAARFGLGAEAVHKDRWRELDISLACAQCDHAWDCAASLRGEGTFAKADCPNAERFAELAAV